MSKPTPTDLGKFDTLKVVFFLEVKPLSDKFEQIVLLPEQRKRVLDAIAAELPEENGALMVTTNDDETFSFPNIRDDYDQAWLDAHPDDGEAK